MTADIALPKDWDRSGLPGWAYFSQELFELECETLFKTLAKKIKSWSNTSLKILKNRLTNRWKTTRKTH